MKFTFEEQAKYFEKKLNLKTNSYLDVMGEEHDYFFMVAGANRNEVLLAFRQAVDEAIHNGETLESFRKRFDEIVAKTGWDYNGGRNWRTRIIYDTNIYGAYNRGRLQQHLELAGVMPYWEYVHNDSAHPRPHHVALNGTIRPASDPFWRYYYPIKAYGCHCTVIAHDEADLQHYGKEVSPPVEIETEEKRIGIRSGNPRVVNLPKGYDVGFEPTNFENVKAGRNRNIDQLLFNKAIAAEPKLASLLLDDVLSKPHAISMLNAVMKEMVDTVATEKLARGQLRNVGVLPMDVIRKLDAMEKAPQSAVIAVRDKDVLHGLRELKQWHNIALPLEFWEKLPEKLRHPQAILLQAKEQFENSAKANDTLLFVYQVEQGKVAIKMDYEVKLKEAISGKKLPHKVNMITTGSVFKDNSALYDFELLWGSLN